MVDALAGEHDDDGLPDLGWLPTRLQVSVLAALYRDFIKHTASGPRQ